MYCKLFSSLYQGTLRGRAHEILVFTNLLAHCDATGVVDKHFRAIAEEVGLSVDQVKDAIAVLEAPDPESRSPEALGARLVRLDEHRVWGWTVVNYVKYREIRNTDDRREQNRQAQARWRASVSIVSRRKPSVSIVSRRKPSVSNSKQNKPKQKQKHIVERERAAAVAVPSNETPPLSRKEFDDLCSMRAIPPDCAEWFWNTHDARNWTDSTGQPIRKVEPLLLNTLKKWRANQAKQQSAGKPFKPELTPEQKADIFLRKML